MTIREALAEIVDICCLLLDSPQIVEIVDPATAQRRPLLPQADDGGSGKRERAKREAPFYTLGVLNAE